MTSPELRAWLEQYRQAWETRDAGAAARLFADDAAYHETPFGTPARGKDGVRAYWSAATEHQRQVKFSYEVLSVTGDSCIAHWRAEYTRVPSGVQAWLDGVFVLEFETGGLCRTLREWWHRTEAPESPVV